MARPLRVEYPGALYHVMNRGNQRATVFHEVSHYGLFLDSLERTAEQFLVQVYCYCLMPNHFHLYVRTERANLSRFMQSLLTGFTLSCNRARGSSGHVFQGRFKSHLVEGDSYHAELSRYIHLNPVRVADWRERSVAERRAELRRYRWSSYPAYLGLRKAPTWLVRDAVLSQWDTPPGEQIPRYRSFVEEGLQRDVKSPYAEAAAQSLVGGETFVKRIKREFLDKREPDRREETSLVALRGAIPLDSVIAAVALAYGVAPVRLLRRTGAHRQARRLAMHLASLHCRDGSSLTALADAFGVTVSGLTRARGRVVEETRQDPRLQALTDRLSQAIKSNA